ncbi:MAG: helix-turn-helix domain-containing protein [Gammaproteobacteria bacterium]|nr:helix-turn-helix domain-containing protein [Gammaproteobacteria bacterium]
MRQTNLIVETLKRELRKQGINYQQVAQQLDLSESSVKRLFAERSFTLTRLVQVCELLNLEFSVEQETELVSDIKLLLMAYFLMSKLEFEDIIRIYDISETEGIRLLAKLDRMKLIELQPGNRVKLMIAKNFSFIPGGPIERFYEREVQAEFFDSSFDGDGELRVYISGVFSRAAIVEMNKKLKQLAIDAHELRLESESVPLDDRFGCSLIGAFRPWEVTVFDRLRRVPNEKKF